MQDSVGHEWRDRRELGWQDDPGRVNWDRRILRAKPERGAPESGTQWLP